jgi:hypothetical protein
MGGNEFLYLMGKGGLGIRQVRVRVGWKWGRSGSLHEAYV